MKIKNLLLAMIGAAALGGISTSAHSDTQSAMAGHSWPNHFDTCFASAFATMTNTCAGAAGGTRLLIIPMQAFTKVLPYNVSAYAGGNGAAGGNDGFTTCEAITVGTNNSSVDFSANVSSSTSNTLQLLGLGTVVSGIPGTLHFECRVAEGGGRVGLLSVN
jgi:hypothetical protein